MKPSAVFAVARASAGAVLALAVGALLAGPVLATGAPRTAAATHQAARRHPARAHRAHRLAQAATQRPAMRAVVDPATGRLVPAPRPTDAPGTAGSAALAAPPAGATATPAPTTPTASPIRKLADGTEIVPLPPDQQEYEVVRLGKDGKLERACVHGDPKAAVFPARREER